MGISYMTMCTKHIYFFTVSSSMNYPINVSYYYWLIFKVDLESRFLCFPWVQRDCGAQQASFCFAVNFAGLLSTSREAVGAMEFVAVWCREVGRATRKM